MFVDENHTSKLKDHLTAKSTLEHMLHRLHHSHDFPGVSKYISAVNHILSSDPDSFDASHLADMILNDYALTSKLIKLANSVIYGFAAGKVTTVTRAVVVLGYVYVRLVSISLFLFENFKSKHHVADLKEEIIRSLWSGMLARKFAIKTGDMDSEEAYICAMLLRLGKLVMIRYFPNEYGKILIRMQERGFPEEKAVISVCATTYEELGMAVARQWNLPDKICESLQPLSASELNTKENPLPKLQVLNSFIRELNQLLEYNARNDRKLSAHKLLKRYVRTISISEPQLHRLIRASAKIVDQHAHAMDFDTATSPFLSYLIAGPQITAPSPKGAEADSMDEAPPASFRLTDSMELKTGADGQAAVQPIDMIFDGIQEISQAIISGINVNDIAAMSLEVLYAALRFHRAIMFFRTDLNQMVALQAGYHRLSRKFLRKAQFKIEDAGDLFNQAVQSGKDLIVADAYDARISHLIPVWYRSHIDAPAFIFLPVSVQNVTLAALYADRAKTGRPISDEQHRYLNMLCNQLALAIRHQQKEGRRLF